jgi:hypothetical protein
MATTRLYYVYGETLAYVAGGALETTTELGLAAGPIFIAPEFFYSDVHTDSGGNMAPSETLFMMGVTRISMTLVHYDPGALDLCIASSCGSSTPGAMTGAGMPMGANGSLMTLLLISATGEQTYQFQNCHLTGPPLEIPLGTSTTIAKVQFRSFPYISSPGNGSNTSSNLWTRV